MKFPELSVDSQCSQQTTQKPTGNNMAAPTTMAATNGACIHLNGTNKAATGASVGAMNCQAAVTKLPSTEAEVRELWRSADAVCFDVDSTVCVDEGIDELAEFLGKSDEVMEITAKAMCGQLDFHQALSQRLDIIHPSLQDIEEFITHRPPRLTPGIRDLVKLLHKRGVPVFLISGGFMSIIKHIAIALNIPQDNVYANRLKFYFDGRFSGFEENALTAHSGGKREIIRILKDKYHFKRVVMIGDGATDMETHPPADAFIGFGANAVRESVKKGSKWYAMSFSELIEELQSDCTYLADETNSSDADSNNSTCD